MRYITLLFGVVCAPLLLMASRPLFQPNHGWGTGNVMRASRHTVLYQNGKAAQQKGHFVSRLTIARLP